MPAPTEEMRKKAKERFKKLSEKKYIRRKKKKSLKQRKRISENLDLKPYNILRKKISKNLKANLKQRL